MSKGKYWLNTILLAVWSLTLGVGPAFAEGGEEVFDAHATDYGYYFQNTDMDFHFGNLVLGSAVNGGVAVGEAFYVASRIQDGDAASWHKEWAGLAQRLRTRGDVSLAAGHRVSAREQFLRAAYAYRISLLAMEPDNPQLYERAAKCRELMKQAGKLFDPPIEYVEIRQGNLTIPGYFRKATGSNAPAPTLIMIGGGETFIEDLYFYLAPQAHERGYNFLTVDLPGQGMQPADGHVFRTDTFVPMRAVVDYALSRKDVAPDRLAAYGISGGGLFVPQAAMHDPRMRAIAMNSAVVDAEELFGTMPAARATDEDKAGWTSFHRGIVRSICWRYGVDPDTPAGLIAANRGNTFDPAKISVPALIIVGEGEYASEEVQKQQQKAIDGFPNPASSMVITPTNEGATNHCVMENRALVGQVLFDWLDEVLQ